MPTIYTTFALAVGNRNFYNHTTNNVASVEVLLADSGSAFYS